MATSTKQLVFGPENMTQLLAAKNFGTISRILINVNTDETGRFLSATAVPVDSTGREILGNNNSSFLINGCPEPPGCSDIS